MEASATLLALLTVVIWSFFTYLSSHLLFLPPFLLVGLSLGIGGLVGLVRIRDWRVPLRTLAVGVAGLFGYHFLLYSAFERAPVVEAGLLNHLWPLLMVLFSPLFLPNYRLGWRHVAGGLCGFTGAALIATGGSLNFDLANLPGYLMAFSAAIGWACYSLTIKRLPPFRTGAVGVFCFVSGLLSLGVYFLTPGASLQPLQQMHAGEWIALVLLGIGPLGLGFYTWDAALKRGDPRVIGSLSFLIPLLSTLILVVLGGQTLTWATGLAMFLIISGAVLGSLDALPLGKRKASERRLVQVK